MDADQARRVLGVGPAATPEEVRTAYRQLVRHRHPDVQGGSAAATAETARLNEAFRTLRLPSLSPGLPPAAAPDHASDSRRTPAGARPATSGAPDGDEAGFVVLRPDGDSLAMAAPAGDVLLWLLDAVHRLGPITYLDRESALFEARVDLGGVACSLLISLQGRGDGTTEAFCTVEALDGRASPPAELAVDAIVAHLAAADTGHAT